MPSWLAPNLQARKRDQANTPLVQVQELQELAKAAPKRSAEEQSFLANQLASNLESEADPVVREHLVRTASAVQTPKSDEMLRKSLEDSDPEMRITACELWGRRGGEEAVERLAHTLSNDTDLDVRMAAARALGETENPAATAALGTALEDPNPAMQYRAVESLKRVTGEDLGNDVKTWVAFVQNGTKPPPKTMAQRLTDWF
jgi:HEAT repeat protein